MFTRFYLGVSRDMSNPGLIQVRYDIQKRINALKYCNYRKITLDVLDYKYCEPDRLGLWWDQSKTADIRCCIDEGTWRKDNGTLDLPQIYTTIVGALEALWVKNKWNGDDLKDIGRMGRFNDSDRFIVPVSYGRVMLSPDRSHRVELFCQLHKDYADYFLCFKEKRNLSPRAIKFLRGYPEPEIFFNVFVNRYWRDNEHFILSDSSEEVFFVFDINKDDFAIEYRPNESSLEVCENRVRAFEAGLTLRERTQLLGMAPH